MINILSSMPVYDMEFCKEELQPFFQNGMKVLVLPFSFSKEVCSADDVDKLYDKEVGKYYDLTVNPLLNLGMKEENIVFINYYRDDPTAVKQMIQTYDVIYFTGGAPNLAIERMIHFGIMEELKKFQKIVMGFSAGAMVQLKEYHISPDEDYDTYLNCEGIGYLDSFDIEVHFEDSIVQQDSIKRAKREVHDTIYAMDNQSVMVVEDNRIRCFGNVKVY